MSSSEANPKRSRWDQGCRGVNPEVAPVVPDDAAIEALMAQAQARQTAREKQFNDSREKKKMIKSGEVPRQPRQKDSAEDSYYGPAAAETQDDAVPISDAAKDKPNFAVSGALAKDAKAGNVYRGVLLKFHEPPEARAPNTLWVSSVLDGRQ